MNDTHSKGLLKDIHNISLVLKTLDLVTLYVSLFVLVRWFGDGQWFPNYNLLALIAVLIFIFASDSALLYRSWRGVIFKAQVKRLLIVWSITVLSLVMVIYLTTPTTDFSRTLVINWFILAPVAMIALRGIFNTILNYFRSKGYNSRKVAIVGVNELCVQASRYIEEHPELGMQIEGFYDERQRNRDPGINFSGQSSNIKSLLKKSRNREIDIVYITLPMQAKKRIKSLINELSDSTVSVYMVPDLYTYELFNGTWSKLGGHPIVSVFDSPFSGLDAFVKRIEDFILSSIIILLISPVLIVVAIAVKITSPGPVLFKQRRYGISGNDINVWKFRSMTVMDNDDDVKQAVKGDERVTPIGRFLRCTSLDELPQFFNVWLGDMSIVGPRPHANVHNEFYRKKIRGYMLRHAVKPGITGWAQINGLRGETDTIEKMQSRIEFDHWYISHWTLWLDLKIIFLTIIKGFTSKNAY